MENGSQRTPIPRHLSGVTDFRGPDRSQTKTCKCQPEKRLCIIARAVSGAELLKAGDLPHGVDRGQRIFK